MKPRTKPTLNAVDLRNVRIIVQQEALTSNREVRKELARLRKENAELRKPKPMPDVVKFLLGEAPMNNYWFGDTYVGHAPYWWRKHLREYFDGFKSSSSEQKG